MINHDKMFGKKSIYAIERNFSSTCSSVEMLKRYMVRKRLGTPDLKHECPSGQIIFYTNLLHCYSSEENSFLQ